MLTNTNINEVVNAQQNPGIFSSAKRLTNLGFEVMNQTNEGYKAIYTAIFDKMWSVKISENLHPSNPNPSLLLETATHMMTQESFSPYCDLKGQGVEEGRLEKLMWILANGHNAYLKLKKQQIQNLCDALNDLGFEVSNSLEFETFQYSGNLRVALHDEEINLSIEENEKGHDCLVYSSLPSKEVSAYESMYSMYFEQEKNSLNLKEQDEAEIFSIILDFVQSAFEGIHEVVNEENQEQEMKTYFSDLNNKLANSNESQDNGYVLKESELASESKDMYLPVMYQFMQNSIMNQSSMEYEYDNQKNSELFYLNLYADYFKQNFTVDGNQVVNEATEAKASFADVKAFCEKLINEKTLIHSTI